MAKEWCEMQMFGLLLIFWLALRTTVYILYMVITFIVRLLSTPAGLISAVVLLGIALVINWTNSNQQREQAAQAAQAQMAELNRQEAEVQRVLANPASILTVTRIGGVDCKNVPLHYFWAEPDNCEYTWGEYKFSNDSQYLAISLTNETCMSGIDPNTWSTGIEYLDHDPNIREGQSFTTYCEESYLGKPITTCGYVNAWRWDGSYYQQVLSKDVLVCW